MEALDDVDGLECVDAIGTRANLVNVVMVASTSTPLRLRSLFEYLSVNWVDFIISGKGIPYFGVDKAIVSTGYGGKFRGIRRKGQLRNIVSIDLQLGNESGGPDPGKNVHLKVSDDNIHLTGALSQEMGEKTYDVVLSHIAMAVGYQKHIRSLDVDTQISTINALLNNGYGNKIDLTFYRFGKMLEFEYKSDPGSTSIDRGSYAEKLRLLCELDPIHDMPSVSVISPHVCNSIYTYKLGKRISLIDTAKKLSNVGYSVHYTNLKADKFMRAMIPIFCPGTTEYSTIFINRKGKEQVNAHRFQVYKRGTVRQYSPTSYDEAIAAHLAFVKALDIGS